MGKINRHNKTKSIAAAVIYVLLLFSAVYAAAPQREFDLFDQGYKDYLSYHPQKAAEEFRMFLKDFPDSSARDAVLFWLGKSLEQLKSFEEAKKIFDDITRQFPDSPFVKYADKEIEVMTGVTGFAGTVPDKLSQAKTTDSSSVKTVMTEDQFKIRAKEIPKAPEQKKESKSVPLQKEISKQTETPVEPEVTPESKKPLPPAPVSEPKKEISKKTETPAESAVAAGSKEPLPAVTVSEQKGIYSAQIGVFKQQKKADVLKSQFKKEGYNVKVTKGTLNGADVFKVLVGEFPDKNKAQAIAAKVRRIYGLNTMVISEAGGEVQIAQGERLKEEGDGDRLKSLSGQEEKKTGLPASGSGKIGVEGEGSRPVASPALSKKGIVYSIQIGVFTKQKTTDKLRSEIEKEGYPVKVMKGTSRGRDVFKVLVGQFADKNEAKSVARTFAKEYGENTIVSMSEAREEIPAARVEFVKDVGDTKRPGPSSAPAVSQTTEITSATQTGSKDSVRKDLPAKTQEQPNKEELGKHAVASEEKKEHVNAGSESFKDEKKQAAGPAEKKKDNMAATATQTVKRDSELKVSGPKSSEEAKNNGKVEKNPEVLKKGNERLSATVVPVNAEKPKTVETTEKSGVSPPPTTEKETRAEFAKTEDKKKSAKRDAGGSDQPPMGIRDVKYTTRDVPEYTAAYRSLCDKLQIKEVLWRTGNDNEDFLNEQVLYEEAKNLHITPDKNKLTEMIENYQLDDREADYLQRYLAISGLIGRKIRDMPEEKVVESIIVRYDESDRYMKIVLGSDLQNLARKGKPFEEIYRLYPDIVRFSVTAFPELERQVKEKVQSLQDDEIVVTWSQDGYMILKPVFKGPVFVSFGDISPGLRDRMKTHILAWTKALREKYSSGQPKENKQ